MNNEGCGAVGDTGLSEGPLLLSGTPNQRIIPPEIRGIFEDLDMRVILRDKEGED